MSESGCVLVLPGGKVRSDRSSRFWQLANLRMAFISATLRRRLGPDVAVKRVRYRLRGWNSPQLDALHDAKQVLGRARDQFEPDQIAVVGHSMGGRVAAHLAARGDVGTVVALAPWWVGNDADLIPVTTRPPTPGPTHAPLVLRSAVPSSAGSTRNGLVSTEPVTTWFASGASGTASSPSSSPINFRQLLGRDTSRARLAGANRADNRIAPPIS